MCDDCFRHVTFFDWEVIYVYEYIGYLASFLVLVSLLMSSVKKLRWINLVGSVTFAVYGFLIGSIPVAILNIGTVTVNVYYLSKMYGSKEYFKILPIDQDTKYLRYFLGYHKKDIMNFASNPDFDVNHSDVSFYILRNVVPAGIFIGKKYTENTLEIELDYVVPSYRDFKMGDYIFNYKKDIFLDKGYTKLITYTDNPLHKRYLKKMGFAVQGGTDDAEKTFFIKSL